MVWGNDLERDLVDILALGLWLTRLVSLQWIHGFATQAPIASSNKLQ